jgi:hypothetical protein
MSEPKTSKKNTVTKKLQAFIDSIAIVQKCKTTGIEDEMMYASKSDGSYLTFVGLENDLKYLMDIGISEQIQSSNGGKVACIGFNPTEKKWYGWSHRAIFGFTVGSECKIGDCGFNSSNEEEFKNWCASFWGDKEYSSGDDKIEKIMGEVYEGEQVEGIEVSYTYNNTVPNEKLRGTKYTNFTPFPREWGKGEWKATNMEEAKQMAIEFADGVS